MYRKIINAQTKDNRGYQGIGYSGDYLMETHLWQAAGCCHPSVSSNGWKIGKIGKSPARTLIVVCASTPSWEPKNPRMNYGAAGEKTQPTVAAAPGKQSPDIFRLLCGNLCH